MRTSFEDLWDAVKSDLSRHARSLSGNDADAEDLVGETCLRMLSSYPEPRPEEDFRRLSFALMTSAYVDNVRRLAKEAAPPVRQSVLSVEDGIQIEEVLSNLPGHVAEACVLRVAGFTVGEIGLALGVPATTVRHWLRACRAEFNREMGT